MLFFSQSLLKRQSNDAGGVRLTFQRHFARKYKLIALFKGEQQKYKMTFFKKESDNLEEFVSKLATYDEIFTHSICNSSFIQSALLDKGIKLPKNESMAIALVCHQHD